MLYSYGYCYFPQRRRAAADEIRRENGEKTTQLYLNSSFFILHSSFFIFPFGVFYFDTLRHRTLASLGY
jgi:hypothetical protein